MSIFSSESFINIYDLRLAISKSGLAFHRGIAYSCDWRCHHYNFRSKYDGLKASKPKTG